MGISYNKYIDYLLCLYKKESNISKSIAPSFRLLLSLFLPKFKGKEDYQKNLFYTKIMEGDLVIMKNGFSFELYETIFKNCFLHSSRYSNGDLQLSLFGTDPATNETAHFADISLEQNSKRLRDDEVVVDCKFKPTLIPQLLELGIIKSQTGICPIKNNIYPVYTIDLTKVQKNYYYAQELVAA